MAITRRQKEVIDFLTNFTQKNGYSPSYEEIAHGLGLTSLATVHKHVTNLQNKGLLQRRTTAAGRSTCCLRAPARRASTACRCWAASRRASRSRPSRWRRRISLGDIIGNREVFALEVRGDSMRDEHIVTGDYVLVERTAPRARARSSSHWWMATTRRSSASTARAK